MATEKEYKVEISHGGDPNLLTLPKGISLRRKVELNQVSEYLDTQDMRLAELGIGLRFRSFGDKDGIGEWTMKIPRIVEAGGSSLREELESRRQRDDLPADILAVLVGLGISDKLVPTVSLSNLRRSFAVEREGAVLPIEIDLDSVTFGDGSTFEELEIELSEMGADNVAREILDSAIRAGGRLSDKTKLERATARSELASKASEVSPDLSIPIWWSENLGRLNSLLVLAWGTVVDVGTVDRLAAVTWEVCALEHLRSGDLDLLAQIIDALVAVGESGPTSVERGLVQSIYRLSGLIRQSKGPIGTGTATSQLCRSSKSELLECGETLLGLVQGVKARSVESIDAALSTLFSISPFRVEPVIEQLIARAFLALVSDRNPRFSNDRQRADPELACAELGNFLKRLDTTGEGR